MKNNLVIPSFYGIFEINSCTKNRIRITINKLKNNIVEIENLKSNLKKIDAIKNFKILPAIGSVTVEFDEQKIDSQFMIGIILNLSGLEKEIFKKRNGKLKYIFNNFLNITDIFIYNKSKGLLDTKTAAGFLLLLYGLKKLKTNPILPAGATLIWWSFNLLTKDLNKEGENNV